jgi:phosphoglycolate phosphatase
MSLGLVQGSLRQLALQIVTQHGRVSPMAQMAGGFMTTVIFDLDGTLADTSGDLIAAANHCFVQMGQGEVLHPKRDAAVGMRGGRAMLTCGLERLGKMDMSLVDAYYPILIEAYRAKIDVHTQMFPGAMDAVGRLRARGAKVGICTNKPVALAELLLKRLGVREAFAAVIGADNLPVRKPDPQAFFETVRQVGGQVERAVMVGDTITDHKTARAAAVPSILVDFGFGDGDLALLKPDAILTSYADLEACLARVLA